MATITQLQHQIYNIEELLEVYNPAKGRWSCVGYAPSKHRRCENPIALHNRTAASALLQTISHGTSTELQIRHTLSQIAGCLLCRHYHQYQASSVTAQWYAVIAANVPTISQSVPQIKSATPYGITQSNTVHSPTVDPGSQLVPVTVPDAILDAADWQNLRDLVAQTYELRASIDTLSRRIDAEMIQDDVSEGARQQGSDEIHGRSGSILGPTTLPVLPSTIHPNTINIQIPIADAEPRIDPAPDVVHASAAGPILDAVQSPINPDPTNSAYIPSVTNNAPGTDTDELEDTQQDGPVSSDGDGNQHPEPQAADNTPSSSSVPIQPSRSAMRNARAPFIAAIEAQERLRREAEAEIARARQESEAERRREEAEEQRRREEAERAERERLGRERAQREAEELERAERLRIIPHQGEQRRIEREQAQAESRARQSLLERVARREQETPVDSRSVSEERSRDQHDWVESWRRYERDWEHMTRIDTSGFDEDVRDSLPWPVRSGRWQDVNTAAVRCFFATAPYARPEEQSRVRQLQLLGLQICRWHEDRIRRLFPAIADDAVAAQLTTVVMQTVNAMVDEIRRN